MSDAQLMVADPRALIPITSRRFRTNLLHYGVQVVGLWCLALVVSTALAAKPAGKKGGRSNAKGAPKIEEMDVERWARLREAERYQLNIAEKYFHAQNWKLALEEYDKYLSLYEKTEAASFAQLKWAMCQVRLRKQNTAIKDGFQSVIDYWPDSPEAVAAAILIAQTYKSIGEVEKAKKAYATVIEQHPDELVAVHSRRDLIEMARVEGDHKSIVTLLNYLVFETPRKGEAAGICVGASQQLASIQFHAGSFDEGMKTLRTSFKEPSLSEQLTSLVRGPIQHLLSKSDKQAAGEKLADATMAYLKSQVPADLTDEADKNRAKQALLQVVSILAVMGNTGDQIGRIYDQILRTCGVTDDLLLRKAAWLKGRKQYDSARTVYGQMKNEFEGQANIVQSYLEENNSKQALKLLEELIGRDEKHANRWRAQMADIHRSLKNYPQAIAIFEELIKHNGDQASHWRWQIAEIHRTTKKYKEAIAVYRQCDNPPESWKMMASCHRAIKEYDEALILYQQVVTSFPPQAPWARLQMGYTFEEAGKKEAAIQTFQQVCKLYPKAPQASESHAHMQNKYKISVTLGGSKDE